MLERAWDIAAVTRRKEFFWDFCVYIVEVTPTQFRYMQDIPFLVLLPYKKPAMTQNVYLPSQEIAYIQTTCHKKIRSFSIFHSENKKKIFLKRQIFLKQFESSRQKFQNFFLYHIFFSI